MPARGQPAWWLCPSSQGQCRARSLGRSEVNTLCSSLCRATWFRDGFQRGRFHCPRWPWRRRAVKPGFSVRLCSPRGAAPSWQRLPTARLSPPPGRWPRGPQSKPRTPGSGAPGRGNENACEPGRAGLCPRDLDCRSVLLPVEHRDADVFMPCSAWPTHCNCFFMTVWSPFGPAWLTPAVQAAQGTANKEEQWSLRMWRA